MKMNWLCARRMMVDGVGETDLCVKDILPCTGERPREEPEGLEVTGAGP